MLEKDPLAGKTFVWTFHDGPTVGASYEHEFREDGTVVFRDTHEHAGSENKKNAAGARYATFEIAPSIHLVSYLSDAGYTLTVAMNLRSGTLHGFASNDTQWFPVTGAVTSP
ncbi:MAG: MoaF N-terminal domain-containing protein [Thermoanaerobaculia bacterium]